MAGYFFMRGLRLNAFPKGPHTYNYILTPNPCFKYCCPNLKYLMVGYLDTKPNANMSLYTFSRPFRHDLIIGYLDPLGLVLRATRMNGQILVCSQG